MAYLLNHTILGFCWFDIIAAVILIGIVVYSVLRLKKMKRERDLLEEKLASQNADKIVEVDTPEEIGN